MSKGKVVIIGAGRSGRGLHGEFCYRENYDIVFGDIDEELVDNLNTQGYYTSFAQNADDENFHSYKIDNYVAYHIHSHRPEYLKALANANIIFTATFYDAFDSIAKDINESIDLRIAEDKQEQVALIVGANCIDLRKTFMKELDKVLAEQEKAYFEKYFVLIESIIYRVSSFPTQEQKDFDKLSIQSDSFEGLQVNTAQKKLADKVVLPDFLIDEEDTERFMHLKIWNVNTTHCSLAFLGQYYGFENVCDAANDDQISRLAYYAGEEAYAGLAKRYNLPLEQNRETKTGLWEWYRDVNMKDTCIRVGNDPLRKLSHNDRFIGSALNALEYGVMPIHICQNAAYGFYFHNEGDPRTDKLQQIIKDKGIEEAIQEVCELDLSNTNEKIVYDLILAKYLDLLKENPVDCYLM